jgi:hypothetical protein
MFAVRRQEVFSGPDCGDFCLGKNNIPSMLKIPFDGKFQKKTKIVPVDQILPESKVIIRFRPFYPLLL